MSKSFVIRYLAFIMLCDKIVVYNFVTGLIKFWFVGFIKLAFK